MGLFTSLMTILLAFFILLSALAPKQQAGFYRGKGLVKNAVGIRGGYGDMKFAKMLGEHGLLSVDMEKEGELEGLLKSENLNSDDGGSGTFEHSQPKELPEANYLVVAVPHEFPPGSSRLPREMEQYFNAMAVSLGERKVTLCAISTEKGG